MNIYFNILGLSYYHKYNIISIVPNTQTDLSDPFEVLSCSLLY